MTEMNVRFHADREQVIFPDLEAGEAMTGEIAEVVVVGNGTVTKNGKTRPSLVLRIDTTEGPVIVMSTARLIVTLAGMIRARHPDLMEDD